MINKKTLDDNDMTIEEYFEKILESIGDNNQANAWSLFDELSEKQQEYFFEHVDMLNHYDADNPTSEMIQLRQYFKNR
jgi:hypothetical protein